MMENKIISNRIVYFDVLRAVSIIAVIMLHVTATALHNYEIGTLEWNISNLYSSLSRFAVPVFIMISGALLLEKEIPITIIYKKYILRFVIAYLAYYVIYNIIDGLEHGRRFASIVKKVISFSYIPYHLWFIVMIVGLYMIVPILKMIVKDKKTSKYFCILSVLISFLLPQVLSIIEIVGGNAFQVINKYFKDLCLYLPIGFTGYFAMGYYLTHLKISRKMEILIYVSGAAGLVMQFVYQQFNDIQVLNGTEPLYDYLNINLRASVFLYSVAVFAFAKNHIKSRNGKIIKAFTGISKLSFGIYLVHLAFINVLEKHFGFLTPIGFNPIISNITCTLIVFVLSVILAMALNKIPYIKRFIT